MFHVGGWVVHCKNKDGSKPNNIWTRVRKQAGLTDFFWHLHTCKSARTLAHLHICTLAHLHKCTLAQVHTCTLAHLHTCTLAYLNTCLLVYWHRCIITSHIFAISNTSVLTYPHTRTLAYTHTSIFAYSIQAYLGITWQWLCSELTRHQLGITLLVGGFC